MTDIPRLPETAPPSTAKTQVLLALASLRSLFPLEQRLKNASPAQRHAYATILTTWMAGRTPVADPADATSVQELARLDALVVGAEGIGCYPFSAKESVIQVAFHSVSVHAMCAFDALAIARLVGAETRITSVCAVCHTTLACSVAANGALSHDQEQAARVIWRTEARAGEHCSLSLCRYIQFICPSCNAPACAQQFTLAQAAVIGNAFFSFQRTLLAGTHAATPA